VGLCLLPQTRDFSVKTKQEQKDVALKFLCQKSLEMRALPFYPVISRVFPFHPRQSNGK
jgi:hypothetical protein